jgi:hypothetical protein
MQPLVNPSLIQLYVIDEFFEVKSISGAYNVDHRIINQVVSSSFGDKTSFTGISYLEFSDNHLDLIRETQLITFFVNNDGFLQTSILGSDSRSYELRNLDNEGLDGLRSVEASVLRSRDLFYIAAFYEQVDSGYLPGQYYLGQDQFGRLGFEVNLNDMLSELIATTNSAGLSFNGMYYDEFHEHVVLDITFLPTENSVRSVRYNVFVSSDGEFIGIQEFNWRNGSILSPKYPHYVYEDGTILSTSERGILIQRVKE